MVNDKEMSRRVGGGEEGQQEDANREMRTGNYRLKMETSSHQTEYK
jgi:hypothetical protein